MSTQDFNHEKTATGIELRDYFAAHAMQALLSEPKVTRDLMLYAGAAYDVADAMLEARKI
jgi:hypothetical protein